MVVGRVCPQRAAGRDRAQPGALDNIGENLVFLRRFSGDTEQIAQTDDKGGRVSRSVWSAWRRWREARRPAEWGSRDSSRVFQLICGRRGSRLLWKAGFPRWHSV